MTIHVVGKYVGLEDSYKSLHEALVHGGFKHRVKVNVKWVEAEALEQEGGDGAARRRARHPRAGRLRRPRHARHDAGGADRARRGSIPFFGICYGFQWATVEFARNVCGLTDADSTECAPDTPTKVIYKLRDLLGVDDLGGTMRLGSYACQLKQGSLSHRLYGADVIHERHRHRYEFNCLYEQTLTDKGLQIVGRSLDGKFVEMVELPDAPLVRRGAVPSRVQEQAAPAASAVRRLRRRGARCTRTRRRDAAASAETRRDGQPARAAQRGRISRVTTIARGRDRPADARRRGAPLLFIGGPCVIESEAHALDLGRAIQAIAARPRRAVRLQGLVRQGQPDVDRLVPRPRPRRGPAHRSRG